MVSCTRESSSHRVRRWGAIPALLLAVLAVAFLQGGNQISGAHPDNVHEAVYAWADANVGQDVPVLIETSGDSGELATFVASSGGTVRRQFQFVSIIEADLSRSAVSAIASHESVSRISLDAPVTSTGGSDDPVEIKNLATAYPFAVDAPQVWNGSTSRTGRGVTVAVLDTGVTNDSKDFKEGKKSRFLADVSLNPSATSFDDGYGHGTHVAGIIGGDGDTLKQKKYIGIAPDVKFVDVKVADDAGNTSVADVIAGIQWIYENKDVYNIRVVNLSLTSSVAQSYRVDPLDAALEFLWFNGIVVVTSAGNLGDVPGAVHYPPANDPFIIVVGAVDDMGTPSRSDDTLTSWSSRGITQDGFQKPDLVAPGRNIISDTDKNSYLATTYPDRRVDEKYLRLSGTSMSAPVVSGIVALMLEQSPALTPGQVKHALLASVRATSSDGPTNMPSAERAVFYNGPPGNTDAGLVPSFLLLNPRLVSPVGALAFVLQSPDPAAAAVAVGFDPMVFGAISWDAISWDAISWDAISWDAIDD